MTQLTVTVVQRESSKCPLARWRLGRTGRTYIRTVAFPTRLICKEAADRRPSRHLAQLAHPLQVSANPSGAHLVANLIETSRFRTTGKSYLFLLLCCCLCTVTWISRESILPFPRFLLFSSFQRPLSNAIAAMFVRSIGI